MSDHDPNGDDTFLKPPVVVDPKPSSSRYSVHNKTRMFPAYVPDPMGQAPQEELSPRVSGVAATVEMEEVTPVEVVKVKPTLGEVLTVPSLVFHLIEKHLVAWKALPSSVRGKVLSNPEKFRIIHSGKTETVPSIVYNGVCLTYGLDGSKLWSIDGLVDL